ncbi:BREX-1 system adenine-specific DNA-methyltransferase PglX [Halalkalibacter krulwichiae]|uniref:site-specific DNA-methyltransferase (adenine-specific) n=1 Tax=Halalkalibacter krulwichiae TaxID=199441 RepID=A0A1X9M9N0_9BACI|nr:BREX-1 system adenine-specific DNA-methyltransferase PglX [Halalkalibacter krulwichiae]ARK30107.1 Eco57I restriction-modification methylase [Halalkalibacter krulwichiae]
MNKAELKTFAIEARRDLLEKVALRARLFGIDEGTSSLSMKEQFGQLTVNGKTYPLQMKPAFTSLERELNIKGYEQLIEEVAYTWFNRIIAIRYMEVHGYLPERVHVLSSSTGKAEPDILNQYVSIDLHVKREEVAVDIRKGDTEAAYRKLFIAQCNALNSALPFLFEKINDYTELLLPDFLLDSESVISRLVRNDELTESFNEVEVIGWLYQFYNTEPKDQVFANLKKNKKIEKYDIPAATQLFTPKWIVQYMVENSLGQIWLESNPDSPLKESMKYYIEPAGQEEEVQKQLEKIRYKNVNLEEITIIDPCVGSGHILVYAFDLLYQMYEEAGYPSSDIPQLILEKNLYGLDIDDRAAQLASFALMMKAREKSRRIFRKDVELNVMSIQESNGLDVDGVVGLLAENVEEEKELHTLLETFVDAKNFGSILQPEKIDYGKYIERIENVDESQLSLENYLAYEQLGSVIALLKQVGILSCRYNAVVTNPPYMGNRSMTTILSNFIKNNYKISKHDFFSVFIERNLKYTLPNGYMGMITQPSWLQLNYFKAFREFIVENTIIKSLLYMGRGNFGIDFGSTSFVIRNFKSPKYNGNYFKLYRRLFQYIDTEDIESIFIKSINVENYIHCFDANKESSYQKIKFTFNQNNFKKIPNTPFSFWVSNQVIGVFSNSRQLAEIAEPRAGLQTGENEKFVRQWYEIPFNKMGIGMGDRETAKNSELKWFPYNKGGNYRKWYGNFENVVNWYNDGIDIKEDKLYKLSIGKCLESNSKPKNIQYYFRESITWSFVSSGSFGVRYSPKGSIFDIGGSSVFPNKKDILYITAFLNSKVAYTFLKIQNDTMNFQVGNIASLPIRTIEGELLEKVNFLAQNCIDISKSDWNSYEISWDFARHKLISLQEESLLISNSFLRLEKYLKENFNKLKDFEEELNLIFIDLYGLVKELNPKVNDEEITLTHPNRELDTKSFLSYFIGCMMGRYSLDVEGLAYAGGEWDESKYQTFNPNNHGLVLITDDRYFDDDIITRLREFLSVAFSPETVDENIEWIAESLTMKKNEPAEERLRRYFIDEFFKDHVKIYQKRPIYWLVDSGKQKGLRTLVYLHRYQPDTMATIRFEHLQEIQAKYNNEISSIDSRIVNPSLSATEKRELDKKKTLFQKRLDELVEFDKDLAMYANEQIAIDLDDGVKVNYDKFKEVLAKI